MTGFEADLVIKMERDGVEAVINQTVTIADGTAAELEDRVRRWLATHAEVYRRYRTAVDLWGSSEELVLAEGEAFHANIWAMTCPDMRPGECFRNAHALALSAPSYRYVEGWALMPFSIPTHHAWVVDERGQVQDPTWKPLYRGYRDRDAKRGSKQPYRGTVSYLGVMPDREDHARWTAARGEPNILAVHDSDIDEVLRLGVREAMRRDLGA